MVKISNIFLHSESEYCKNIRAFELSFWVEKRNGLSTVVKYVLLCLEFFWMENIHSMHRLKASNICCLEIQILVYGNYSMLPIYMVLKS